MRDEEIALRQVILNLQESVSRLELERDVLVAIESEQLNVIEGAVLLGLTLDDLAARRHEVAARAERVMSEWRQTNPPKWVNRLDTAIRQEQAGNPIL